MGRRSASNKGRKSKKAKGGGGGGGGKSSVGNDGIGALSSSGADDGSLLSVDPARIRFQYSRIRPYFSGCGRSVRSTLDSIRNGELKPEELPPIQVIVGPEGGNNEDEGPWYFSLNNRRLWVLKRCREEGLLRGDAIRVRVREPKSRREAEKYTLANCALEAKFIRERNPDAPRETKETTEEKGSASSTVRGANGEDADKADREAKAVQSDDARPNREEDEESDDGSGGGGRSDDIGSDESSDESSEDEDDGGANECTNRFSAIDMDASSDESSEDE